jgi:uncharacterized membrane protein
MIKTIERPYKSIIRLEPNRSASWHQTKLVIMCLSGFMLLLGVGWLIAGVWLILPFVFLDIFVFSYFFYRVCQATYRREYIIISADKVVCRSGIRRLGRSVNFRRPCYLVVHKRPSSSHLYAFSLSDDINFLPIGRFLNEDDLHQLRTLLRDHGLIEINQQWWGKFDQGINVL